MKPETIRRLNGGAAIVWLALIPPTILFWKQSILWVALMSIWANFATHYGAWLTSRTEVRAKNVEEAQNVESAENVERAEHVDGR